ncbi:uncharacterized protein LOC120342264 isoform X2 [Styela clava]
MSDQNGSIMESQEKKNSSVTGAALVASKDKPEACTEEDGNGNKEKTSLESIDVSKHSDAEIDKNNSVAKLKHDSKEPCINSNSFPTACEELKKTLLKNSSATKSSLDIHGNEDVKPESKKTERVVENGVMESDVHMADTEETYEIEGMKDREEGLVNQSQKETNDTTVIKDESSETADCSNDTKSEPTTGTTHPNDKVEKSNEDTGLKQLTAKYTRVGSAQLITRPVSTAANDRVEPKYFKTCAEPYESTANFKTKSLSAKSESKAANDKSKIAEKRTEKFVVRNISKVSKLYKVSNLNYRIKPVRHMTPKNLVCPVIYVGEPAFVDPEDFCDGDANNSSSPLISSSFTEEILNDVNENNLYDIDSLKQVFIPNETSKTITTIKMPLHFPSAAQPSFIPKTEILPVMSVPNYKPASVLINTVTPNSNQGYKIVARTVPSATLAQSNSIQASKLGGANYSTFTVPFSAMKKLISFNARQISNEVKVKAKQTPTKQPTVVVAPKSPITFSSPGLASTETSIVSKVKTFTIPPAIRTKSKSDQSLNISAAKPTIKPLPVISPLSAQKVPKTAIHPLPALNLPSAQVITIKPGNTGAVIQTTQCNKTIIVSASQANQVIRIDDKAKVSISKFVTASKANITKTVVAKPENMTSSPPKFAPLREGVEVAFEDGVKHFITSLRQLTFLDDELVKSWSQLKKGTKVAAKWKDGFVYDATVVACYFNTKKNDAEPKKVEITKTTQPVVKLIKISDQKIPNLKGKEDQKSNIGCTGCKKIFSSVILFRKHQKLLCKSPGVIIEDKNAGLTDAVLEAVKKCEKNSNKNLKKTAKIENTATKPANKASKRSASDESVQVSNKRRKIEDVCSPKSSNTKSFISKDEGALFKNGTKFLHRWQLDDGESKWYQGEVIRVIPPFKAFLDQEFEVKYKGEKEIYILKLYEDYPTDIRLMGKS